MKTFQLILLFLIACFLSGCDRDKPVSNIPEKKSSFQKIIFTQPQSESTITLISETECEIANRGEILLAEYSRQDNKLRVVTRALGQASVTYLEILPEGLRDPSSGKVYLLPEPLIKFREQMRIAQEAEATRQRAELERIRKEEEDQKARKQEAARKLLESKTPTTVLATFSCPHEFANPRIPNLQDIKVTDVDVTFRNHYGNRVYKIWYGYVSGVERANKYVMIAFKSRVQDCDYESSMLIPFDTEEHRATIVQEVNKAIAAWRTRFPEQASHPGD